MPTIEFMPDRLNAEPVVFRGFTTPELGITTLLSIFGGLIIAIPIMPFLGWVALPTISLLMPLITIILGGRLLARFKRGKPENYLYRRIEWFLSSCGVGSNRLICRSQVLSLRRLHSVTFHCKESHESI